MTDELIEACRDVIRWYWDQIYDGPPGPQDDEGGSGVAWEISQLQSILERIEKQ